MYFPWLWNQWQFEYHLWDPNTVLWSEVAMSFLNDNKIHRVHKGGRSEKGRI